MSVAGIAPGGDPIRIAAALGDDGAGRALRVRRHGSASFIQPGGKREPLGEFEHDAVNEAGQRVRAEVFAVRLHGAPRAQAGIAELAWIPTRPPYPVPVAPLGAAHLLPLLAAA
ncbi:MAG TPA: NUDIX hydrolase [Xanthomonadaceae bacterium]|nr:NUDIX hydrolase [Xanthomonadaceae bacterium]